MQDQDCAGWTRETAPDDRGGQASPPRLLVIDDVAVHRMVICRVAAKAGLAPSEAEGCGDAVALARSQAFDCATLDLSLGEQKGFDVMLGFSMLHCRFPIVIISGSGPQVTRDALDSGIRLGLTMLPPVSKPIDLTRLREILASIAFACDRRQLRAARAG